MSIEIERLKTRFDDLFVNDGLTNIKFFIDRRHEMNRLDFAAELNRIQDTIAAGDFVKFADVDKDQQTHQFDEAF